ncbi:MAG: hypothetical protein M3Z56_10055, partial [Bacteroidota bacterium]|nr:hypothetical protein [Bacteroidota bacterium]
FVYDLTGSHLLITGTTMIICLYLSIRFTDAFMAIVSYAAFFVSIFLLCLKLGTIAKVMAPLFMLIVSAGIYIFMKFLEKRDGIQVYHYCIKAVTFLTLITFYASANYFVVRELTNKMFDGNLAGNNEMMMGWLFWIFTFLIPVIYLFYGIAKKDFLFIRTGLGLIAAAVFTLRYYHRVFSIEIAMLIGGGILIMISYLLIQYLKVPKHGYTFQNLHPSNKKLLNAEALIVAQTFGTTSSHENNSLYAGGSGGGGGATSNF